MGEPFKYFLDAKSIQVLMELGLIVSAKDMDNVPPGAVAWSEREWGWIFEMTDLPKL